MAWEKRGNRSYFYQKKRIGGKVKSEYVGAGEVAELIARRESFDCGQHHLSKKRDRKRLPIVKEV